MSCVMFKVKILRLLRMLGKGDADTSEAMNDILAQVCSNATIHFQRAAACNAMHCIDFAIMSIRPSDACIATKQNDALWIF